MIAVALNRRSPTIAMIRNNHTSALILVGDGRVEQVFLEKPHFRFSAIDDLAKVSFYDSKRYRHAMLRLTNLKLPLHHGATTSRALTRPACFPPERVRDMLAASFRQRWMESRWQRP